MSTSVQNSPGSGTAAAPGKPIGELVFALLIVSIGVVGFVAGAGIQTPPSASDIGPRAFPFAVSALLVAVGARRVLRQEETDQRMADGRSIGFSFHIDVVDHRYRRRVKGDALQRPQDQGP